MNHSHGDPTLPSGRDDGIETSIVSLQCLVQAGVAIVTRASAARPMDQLVLRAASLSARTQMIFPPFRAHGRCAEWAL